MISSNQGDMSLMTNKILIKGANLFKTKEELVTVGTVIKIEDRETSKLLKVCFKTGSDKLAKKYLLYHQEILGIDISINDIFLWTGKSIYLLYNGLLVPLRCLDKKTYKIDPQSLIAVFHEQQDILTSVNETMIRR